MKKIVTRGLYTGIGLSIVLLGIIFYWFPTDNPSYAQTSGPNDVTWQRQAISISSNNSELSLILPSLESSSEYIVGIAPTTEGENEEIVIGVVSWVDATFGNSISVKRISSVANYPSSLVDGVAGFVEIDGSEDLFATDESLVVYIKVNPGTDLTVEKGEETLADRSVGDGFVIQKGVPISMKGVGPAGLLMQLQTNQLARSASQNN